MTAPVRTSAVITHEVGLHARPAVTLTRLAKTFDAAIRLRGLPDGAWADAKSIVKVMALKLRTGTTIEIEATGAEAATAATALRDLVARDFADER
jgi:phosphocarrier protein